MAHPVVLIHGMWCTGANFSRLRETLEARGNTCHAPDLPHHAAGVVDDGVGNQSLTDCLSYLEGFVRDQKFLLPPVLVGHSMGGLLAQQLAARLSPPGPLALVLLTPVAPRGIIGIRWSNFVAGLSVFSKWGWWRKPHKPSLARFSVSLFNGVPAERHAASYATLVKESGRCAFEVLLWFFDRRRASAVDTAAITCPVYVVSCGQDKLTPAGVVRRNAALYPQAALRHYPARGHWVLDDPDTDEMNIDIANWIQGQEQRAASLSRA